MDKTKQKSKKEKPNKHVDKEKSPSFVADVKTLKENLKIREILRTVKMNSSMRIKAPRGSKVMTNKDFHENEDIFEGIASTEVDLSDPPSATNPLVVNHNIDGSEKSDDTYLQDDDSPSDSNDFKEDAADPGILQKSQSLSERLDEVTLNNQYKSNNLQVPPVLQTPFENSHIRGRDRKLSLDHTMLSKRDGLSQSEVDLHLIGKSPLERKSSFFRKRMDSFLKNTTEIFKKQSLGRNSSIQRKGSTCSHMSVSMQSLNENEPYIEEHDSETLENYNKEVQGSMSSLRSTATPVRSNSSVSVTQSDRLQPDQSEDDSLAGSQPALVSSQPFVDSSTISINNLPQESLLNSRAISMSSGLDTATNPRRRKASKANRVTWVASESLTDYFRRLIQDEKSTQMHVSNSYQDFPMIQDSSSYGAKTDSKGRRLSYQRAVSGEDPVLPSRYQDSSLRRRKIPEAPEGTNDLANYLAKFTKNGIPELAGFEIQNISDKAKSYLAWALQEKNLEEVCDWKTLPHGEEPRQAVIRELIYTEADYIRHLKNIVEVYIGTAHALQDASLLLDLQTSCLFLNIPDVLNANLLFWEKVLYPMIDDAVTNRTAFNTDLMAPGFTEFGKIFAPYEFYVCHQNTAVDYLRKISTNPAFMTYITWCNNKNTTTRLQLGDVLVKPMQRITKYSVLYTRLSNYTTSLHDKMKVETLVKTCDYFVQGINRAIRQNEELDQLNELNKMLEPYEVDCKDEEMEKYFRMANEMNLKAPMARCDPAHHRTVVHQADMRFKDHINTKEIEVRAIILTDMVLICRKIVRASGVAYKMIRPKYTVEKMSTYPRTGSKAGTEIAGIIHLGLNDQNNASTIFCLSEMPKDPDPRTTYKTWSDKLHEAKVAYDLTMWVKKHHIEELADLEADYYPEEFRITYPENWANEQRARERVAVMMHPNTRPKKDPKPDLGDDFIAARGPETFFGHLTEPVLIKSTTTSRGSSFQATQSTSSRNSRMSSFQQSSATSHEDTSHMHKAGSTDLLLLPPNIENLTQSTSSIGEATSRSDTIAISQRQTPCMILQQPSPHRTHVLEPRSASACGGNHTLHVSPNNSMGRSMPDLSVEISPMKPQPVLQSASEKLYKSHQELLHKNRLAATHQHFLTPDHRGTSYPPPSHSRVSLKRGLAFSYSIKNPPLTKMGHVCSQSQNQLDQPATIQLQVPQDCLPSTSTDSGDKKKQLLSGFRFGGKSPTRESSNTEQRSPIAGPSKEDGDKPGTTDKSNKSAKGKSDKDSKGKGGK